MKEFYQVFYYRANKYSDGEIENDGTLWLVGCYESKEKAIEAIKEDAKMTYLKDTQDDLDEVGDFQCFDTETEVGFHGYYNIVVLELNKKIDKRIMY
ncbi:hypothetical protein OFO01_07155 [Campylobacter sp. JMF_01 NE2]|uniref:hypothetical protein n=1 Tax=unclassified Campylobacter TaxID=2593542 RepID=UPI0022E9B27B|nr:MULTISPECIES: hypothetical protein [unclassified Campylobacter]MDA3053259.1 hypothetical protein [Campylobacter sp. JMF_03 NE3]MDA3067558.1 hypothetical protein [Campylobacter sp. JMF_01 NE2]